MIAYALLFALASAQAEPPAQQPETDGKPAPWADNERELRNAGAFEKSSEPEARLHLERFASCIVRKNAERAATTLRMDFTTPAYQRAMRALTDDDKECMGNRRWMGASRLLVAGELAESLLERDGAPLLPQLAKAGMSEATPAYSFTDRVAICVVRSVPNDVAALFATARNSAEETARLSALATPMAMCAKAAQARRPIAVNPAGLRAMLATASYRSVAQVKS